jgi:hypothetical protein
MCKNIIQSHSSLCLSYNKDAVTTAVWLTVEFCMVSTPTLLVYFPLIGLKDEKSSVVWPVRMVTFGACLY